MTEKNTKFTHGADNIADVTFSVEGMSCKSCENKVIASVSKLTGVKDVSANFAEGKASVRFEMDKIGLMSRPMPSVAVRVRTSVSVFAKCSTSRAMSTGKSICGTSS